MQRGRRRGAPEVSARPAVPGGASVGTKDSDEDATRLGDTDPGAKSGSELVTDATPRGEAGGRNERRAGAQLATA